jgi:hypothetical protein
MTIEDAGRALLRELAVPIGAITILASAADQTLHVLVGQDYRYLLSRIPTTYGGYAVSADIRTPSRSAA